VHCDIVKRHNAFVTTTFDDNTIFEMKQALVISVLILSLVSFVYSDEETQVKETERCKFI